MGPVHHSRQGAPERNRPDTGPVFSVVRWPRAQSIPEIPTNIPVANLTNMRRTDHNIGEPEKAESAPAGITENDPTPVSGSLPPPHHVPQVYQPKPDGRANLAPAITRNPAAAAQRSSRRPIDSSAKCEVAGPARPGSQRRMDGLSVVYGYGAKVNIFLVALQILAKPCRIWTR